MGEDPPASATVEELEQRLKEARRWARLAKPGKSRRAAKEHVKKSENSLLKQANKELTASKRQTAKLEALIQRLEGKREKTRGLKRKRSD